MNRVILNSNLRVAFLQFSHRARPNVSANNGNVNNVRLRPSRLRPNTNTTDITCKLHYTTMSSQNQTVKYGTKQHWREAATLLIAAKDQNSFAEDQGGFDYRILFMKRQGGGNAFGGASVFPGGVVDNADFSPKWLQYYQRLGINTVQQFGWTHMEGKQRAGPLSADRQPGLLPNDVAFRICAIRETFEESGILLANKAVDVLQSISDIKSKQFSPASFYPDLTHEEFLEWRSRVYKDASQFLVMCQELDVFPNVWSLFELSNTLTPRSVRRRYDTVFYVSTFDKLPHVIVDEQEMENKQWLTPAEGLKLHCQGQVYLVPPQLLECSRFLDFPKIIDVQSYAANIMDEGMDVSLPVGCYLKDCLLHSYPGDDCYPENVSLASITEIAKLDETEEENLRRVTNLHRITFYSDRSFAFKCNIKLPHGEHPPRDINSVEWIHNHKM